MDKCAEYIEEKKEVKLWSEVALNDILAEIEFQACPLDGRWLEIDNHDDLVAAERFHHLPDDPDKFAGAVSKSIVVSPAFSHLLVVIRYKGGVVL